MTISVVQLPLPSRLPRSGTRSATRSAGAGSGEPTGARVRASQRWCGPQVEGSRAGTPAVPVVHLVSFSGRASVNALPCWPASVGPLPDRAAVLDVLFGTAAPDPVDGPEAA